MQSEQSATCRVCGAQAERIFDATILRKFAVGYYRCSQCDFVQTQEPTWLNEAYSSAINEIDLGPIRRSEIAAERVGALLSTYFKDGQRFLDYGGGYGVFVRMMRDRGFNFYRYDIHCANLFAKHFDGDLGEESYDLITAFEVFEHLVFPLNDIGAMAAKTDGIIFSTTLHPETLTSVEEWDYFGPEHGQHIGFYSRRTLEWIAEKLGLHLVSDDYENHLFSRRKISERGFRFLIGNRKVSRLTRLYLRSAKARPTLLWKDVDLAKAAVYHQLL